MQTGQEYGLCRDRLNGTLMRCNEKGGVYGNADTGISL